VNDTESRYSFDLDATPAPAASRGADHTTLMTSKNAAFLALLGTLILTVLFALDFVNVLLGVSRSLVPAVALPRALIYLFAGLCLTIFFAVFHRSQ
jgi:hypothetical protein